MILQVGVFVQVNNSTLFPWTRNRNVVTQPALVPTQAEREGDLSQTLTPQGQPVQVIAGDLKAGSVGTAFVGRALDDPRRALFVRALATSALQ